MTEQENSLADALAHCRESDVKRLVRRRLDAGAAAAEIIAECNRGMVELGARFAREECFLPDLMFGGMIMKSIAAELGPGLTEASAGEPVATVVMGAVEHDVHDIGKDIVVMMLRGAGFEVIDLGINVPPQKFVEAARDHRAAVVGMSILLTTCFQSVGNTVEAIKEAGLRRDVSIMVGGAAAGELLSRQTGCDYYGKTAVDGLCYARQVVGIGNEGG